MLCSSLSQQCTLEKSWHDPLTIPYGLYYYGMSCITLYTGRAAAQPVGGPSRGPLGDLVPVYVQVLVFLAMACLLYLVYTCMEENPYNPLLPLLDGLSEALESQEEGPVALAPPVDPANPTVDL